MYQYKAVIDRVVDGDTMDAIIDLGFNIKVKQRLRIDGFDAPEIWHPSNDKEQEHGYQAKARAVVLVEGKEVLVMTSKHPGIYNRYGAVVLLPDGQSFSEIMLLEGFQKKESYE
jgi:micrococcal nuclease